jgi:hypothetical protein
MASNPNNARSEPTGRAEHARSPAQEKNQRQSDRVLLALPIRVSGVRGQGKELLEEGQTVDISRQGATIKVERELFAGETIKIRRLDGIGKEVMARVVGRVGAGPEGHLFGVTMLDPDVVYPWGVVFPLFPDTDKTVLRALLRCVVCERTEVCYLNEFEADLFLYHHSISRTCERCGGWTSWNRPQAHTSAGSVATVVPGTQNRRSRDRIHVEAVGCVRHPDRGNEVVVVIELARGGLRFYSASEYPEESRVEIAVPYSSKAPNIYMPAKIVSSRKGVGKGVLEYEYGVAYLE